jgi:uncharacterized protein (DUF885 family)
MSPLRRSFSPIGKSKFVALTYTPAIILCVTLFGCSTVLQHLPSLNRGSPSSESRKLHELFESYFEAYLTLFPTFATEVGDHRYDDQLEIAISEEHIGAQRRLVQHALTRIGEINSHEIDPGERLYVEVFTRGLRLAIAGQRFKQHLQPVRQLASLVVEFPLFGSGSGFHPFRTVTDYENFLKRIERFELWVETAIVNLRKGAELGIVQPRAVIERTLPQLEAMIVTDTKASLFYQPILRMPDHFSEAERARLTRAYTEAIEQRVVPTYRRLLAFLKDDYLGKTRSTTALSALPDGNAWYEHLVKTQTTTDLTPDEIFQIGLEEIARIKKELERLRDDRGFRGSLKELSDHLTATAPRGYNSRSDLVKGYEAIRHTVTPELSKLFGRIPKAPFEIRTIEEFRERAAPSQYWTASPDGSRPGIFYVNASRIETSPRRASEPLFLHEALPGHHFQLSLQQEREDLPRFQRFADYTAFVEGWALYAESLGAELGLYKEPSQYFSRLNSELFRAARLVVDVGLHRKNWSREQAIKFLMDTTMSSESGASSEIDRYIAVPAQALGYKIGQLRISAIRAKAETALGQKFDIRAFHDELLKDGALPLDLLEKKMNRWIEQMRR